MKTLILKTTFVLAIFVALFGLSAQTAEAATPILTITNAGNSQVRIEVNGDVNSSVQLYYYNPPVSGSIVNAGVIGSTNSSGYFSTVVSQNAYGIPTGTNVFVNVNNQQSASVTWPTITGGNVTLGQNNLYLNVNQTNTVSISGGTGTYYVSSNSNSNVASASINGSTVSVSGINGGNTTLTICSASAGSSCATLYVSVGGYNNNGSNISFSQNNVNVQVGQNQSVTIYGSGSYYLSGNTASGIASVTISGQTLNVYGIGNGSATFTICSQQGNTSCGSLYVTVYSSYNNNNYYPPTNYYPNNNTYYYQQPVYTQPTVTYIQPTVQRTYGQPVTGVYLSQIPATGIKFNLKTILFLLGVIMWSAAIAYFAVNRRVNHRLAPVSSLTKADAFKLKQLERIK